MPVFLCLFQYPNVGKAWYYGPAKASRLMIGALKSDCINKSYVCLTLHCEVI